MVGGLQARGPYAQGALVICLLTAPAGLPSAGRAARIRIAAQAPLSCISRPWRSSPPHGCLDISVLFEGRTYDAIKQGKPCHVASLAVDVWRHPQDRANIVLTAIFKMSIRLIKFWERYHVVARVGNGRVFCPLGERGFLISTTAWWYRTSEWILSRELVIWVGSRS